MNTLVKTVVTGALLTAFIAGTSAFAGDNDHFIDTGYSAKAESVEIKKVSFEQATLDIKDFSSNR